mgnify:CR=1 FL=1
MKKRQPRTAPHRSFYLKNGDYIHFWREESFFLLTRQEIYIKCKAYIDGELYTEWGETKLQAFRRVRIKIKMKQDPAFARAYRKMTGEPGLQDPHELYKKMTR